MIFALYNLSHCLASWSGVLAADDDGWGGIGQFVLIIVLLVLGGLGSLIAKIKEKHEAEQARRKARDSEQERSAGPARRVSAGPVETEPRSREASPPRRQPTKAEQAIAALRGVLTGQEEEAPSPPPPAAPRRVARGRVGLGEGVRGEVRQVERRLSDEEAERSRRIGKIGRLRTSLADEPDQPEPPTAHKPRVLVDLSGRKEAMRGIIYSEILGPPKALRPGPETWD